MGKKRTNINAQETVVEALWEFARRQHDDPSPVGRCSSASRPDVKVSLPAVGDALDTIMHAFGYDVQEIQ